jgi:hypothetical protein
LGSGTSDKEGRIDAGSQTDVVSINVKGGKKGMADLRYCMIFQSCEETHRIPLYFEELFPCPGGVEASFFAKRAIRMFASPSPHRPRLIRYRDGIVL